MLLESRSTHICVMIFSEVRSKAISYIEYLVAKPRALESLGPHVEKFPPFTGT